MAGLEKLDIKFFKFFSDTKELDFTDDGKAKNILLYGENGSGKSTIFWALYTFLQSSFKEKGNIKNYFSETTNPKSLVNTFEDDISKSYIKLSVRNDENSIEDFTISKDKIDVYKIEEDEEDLDNIITDMNLSSDFINYKYIFRFFNFLHRDDIELFELFKYEIFQFKIDEISLKDLLEKIESIDNDEYISEGTYLDKQAELEVFNSSLKLIMSKLELPTNQYIKKFKIQNIKVSFSITEGNYEGIEEQRDKNSYKYKFNKPKINFVIKQNDKLIPKPQSYFNEAKLTAIALSLRLAVTQIKAKNSSIKLFVIDDLLVSLDMSNRDTVLDILLTDYTLKDFQKIILTHDRAFFEMAKDRFNYKEKGKWKYFEMYVDNQGDFEKPFILPNRDYFEKAEYFFLKYDYSACANYLRKETERLLKALVCHHRDLSCEDTKNLQNLIDKVKAKGALNEKENIVERVRELVKFDEFDKFIEFNLATLSDIKDKKTIGVIRTELKRFKDFTNKEIEGLTATLKMLEEFKNSILNPQSHDDTKVAIYRKELEEAMKTIQKLRNEI